MKREFFFALLIIAGSEARADADLSASLTVSGTFKPGSTVSYHATATNLAMVADDNGPDHEFVLPIPATIAIQPQSLLATSGTLAFDSVNASITWDGSLAAGQSVDVDFAATIAPSATGTVSVQGTLTFIIPTPDGQINDTVLTDDPSLPGTQDPTNFTITALPVRLQSFNVD